MTEHSEHQSNECWLAMHARCENPYCDCLCHTVWEWEDAQIWEAD